MTLMTEDVILNQDQDTIDITTTFWSKDFVMTAVG